MVTVQRILKLGLTLAFVVGVVMFCLAKREQQPIKAEYDRLTAKFGEMPAIAPDRYQVLRLPTNEPWDLMWRFRRPENTGILIEDYIAFGGGSCSGSLYSNDNNRDASIVRFHIDFDRPQMRCFFKFDGGASTCGSGDKKTADAFREHWDELKIETVSSSHAVDFSPDEILELVRITAPAKFADGSSVRSGKDGLCLLVRVGAQAAFDQEKAAAEKQR
ncbi:hypothetical protein DSM3645_21487 [Blastopirellula marina DSM 3645]|uniref:Uncharacterized protein n=1 Tax=Blastopirellula marina DSM 3645 TaxID=314230 RepID=A3ZR91_9BACT|nr:hypothetical protein DSM3645_21487 [Blastopirellula marina DSM 3645]